MKRAQLRIVLFSCRFLSELFRSYSQFILVATLAHIHTTHTYFWLKLLKKVKSISKRTENLLTTNFLSNSNLFMSIGSEYMLSGFFFFFFSNKKIQTNHKHHHHDHHLYFMLKNQINIQTSLSFHLIIL
jgi:hypothetical protein